MRTSLLAGGGIVALMLAVALLLRQCEGEVAPAPRATAVASVAVQRC